MKISININENDSFFINNIKKFNQLIKEGKQIVFIVNPKEPENMIYISNMISYAMTHLGFDKKNIITYEESKKMHFDLTVEETDDFAVITNNNIGSIVITPQDKLYNNIEVMSKEGELPSVQKPWTLYYPDEGTLGTYNKCKMIDDLIYLNKYRYDHVAIDYLANKISYKELFDNVKKAARAFKEMGVKEGEVVTMFSITLPELVYTSLALNSIGALANIPDFRLNSKTLEKFMTMTNSKKLIIFDKLIPVYEKVKDKIGATDVIFVTAKDSMKPSVRLGYEVKNLLSGTKEETPKGSEYISWNSFINKGKNYVGQVNSLYKENTPSTLVYTSGTTGIPKAAVLSNENFTSIGYSNEYAVHQMKPKDKVIAVMPLSLAYGSTCGMYNPLRTGATLVMRPDFNMNLLGDFIQKKGINHGMLAPTMWENILHSKKYPGGYEKVLSVTAGGDKIVNALEEELNDYLKDNGCKCKVTKGYGMTELAGAATYTSYNECNSLGSAGIPLIKNNAKIVDPETGEELGYNIPGKVMLTGPGIIYGYWNNEEDAKETFIKENDVVWADTKDIGYMAENGEIFILDRQKRMLIRPDGHNVFPSAIENVISNHYAVSSCAVVGIPSTETKGGQIPTAYIVLKDEYINNSDEILKDIISFSSENLSVRDNALDFHIRQSIPFTNSGKLDWKKVEQEEIQKLQLKK